MARIRSADTQPELIVRKALHREGIRYRLQFRTPGGKADLVVPAKKFALFIDGCFWHGCPEHYVHPRSNPEFWDRKLRENVDRDRRQTLALQEEGWNVLRVWEHEVVEAPLEVLALIRGALRRRSRPRGGWRVVRVRSTGSGLKEELRIHEDLLNPLKRLEVVRDRTTAKTGRVAMGGRKMSVGAAMSAAHEPQRDAQRHGRS